MHVCNKLLKDVSELRQNTRWQTSAMWKKTLYTLVGFDVYGKQIFRP
jgi:hypothetical protein